jgi:hypothetical protein
LGLEDLLKIHPGNVLVIAGVFNAGKTAFCLNFAAMNMNQFPVTYLSSEMGTEEFNERLYNFKDVKKWKMKAYERSSNFADLIKKDEVTIVDYLEVPEEFWIVGKWLRQIHDKLGKGVALVAIQKDPAKMFGLGGSHGLNIPRLYLTINNGKATILKAKAWKDPKNNPNGKSIEFKIVNGSKFLPAKKWS